MIAISLNTYGSHRRHSSLMRSYSACTRIYNIDINDGLREKKPRATDQMRSD